MMGTNTKAARAAAALRALLEQLTANTKPEDLRAALEAVCEELETRQEVVVDGQAYTVDDLDFAEQLELRDLCRETSGYPDAQPGQVTLVEFLPSLVTVLHRRTDPSYTLEQATKLRWSDILRDETPAAEGDPQPAGEAPEPVGASQE